jgi:replicative DNA helicase
VKDENDKLRAGQLPDDPFDGETVSAEVPRILSVRDLLQSSLTRATTRERRVYGTSGHCRIDEATGGLRPGDVWLCGADTSWGKSSFAVMLADENIKRGKRVLIVSAEDSEATYGDRLMRRRSGVPAERMRHRRLTAADQDAMAEALAKGEPLPVFIDARGRPVEWLAPRCKQAIVEHAIDIVVFDYVGAFVGKLKQPDRRGMVHYVARVLTDVAKTAKPGGIAGVILSQLTHSDEETVPGKYAIRDSKDLTQMSEVTLIGFLAPRDVPDRGIRKGDRCIKLAKVKEGPAGGQVRMAWNDVTACFDAVHDELDPEPATPADDDWGTWDNE